MEHEIPTYNKEPKGIYYVNIHKDRTTINRQFSFNEAVNFVIEKSKHYGSIYSIDTIKYDEQKVLGETIKTLHSVCTYCGKSLGSKYSFSYGIPNIPRTYKCNREDCEKE